MLSGYGLSLKFIELAHFVNNIILRPLFAGKLEVLINIRRTVGNKIAFLNRIAHLKKRGSAETYRVFNLGFLTFTLLS